MGVFLRRGVLRPCVLAQNGCACPGTSVLGDHGGAQDPSLRMRIALLSAGWYKHQPERLNTSKFLAMSFVGIVECFSAAKVCAPQRKCEKIEDSNLNAKKDTRTLQNSLL